MAGRGGGRAARDRDPTWKAREDPARLPRRVLCRRPFRLRNGPPPERLGQASAPARGWPAAAAKRSATPAGGGGGGGGRCAPRAPRPGSWATRLSALRSQRRPRSRAAARAASPGNGGVLPGSAALGACGERTAAEGAGGGGGRARGTTATRAWRAAASDLGC
nr:alanine and glycine-rich protein-like [Oryctolagus cuniculus]